MPALSIHRPPSVFKAPSSALDHSHALIFHPRVLCPAYSMANAAGGAGRVQLLHGQDPSSDALLPPQFPSLHPALVFSRREVDALGGLHLVRADFVDLPAALAVNPQADAVPHINGNVVMPDAACERVRNQSS